MSSPARQKYVLRPRRSRFVDIFRTTPARTVCPNFYVLSHANGCTFAPHCDYCYLKSSFWYLHEQQAFSNVRKMLAEVQHWIARDGLESYVLNTGNLSDSLSFEQVRPAMLALVELFRTQAAAKGRKHSLLLVTKGGTAHCKPLLTAEPCPNVIVSFSVNNPLVARRHEQGAPPPKDRLEAARQLKAAGWRVRIRIDPMFLGYDYAWVFDQVRQLSPERVTLGSLRAERSLPRYVEDGIFDELERPAGDAGLARYPRALRLAMYRQAAAALAGVCPIGLCEETRDIWDDLNLDATAKCCNCGL